MKYTYLWFAMVGALCGTGELKGDALNVEERLSLSFSEIALTNGVSLVLKVKEFDPNVLLVCTEGQRGFYPAANGSVYVIEKGKALRFHYSRSPAMTISLIESPDVEKRFPHVPLEFRQPKEYMLLFEDGSDVTLISPIRNISYTLGEGVIRHFRFPFQSVWRSEREYNRWWAGMPYRGRFNSIKKRGETEKSSAESALKYVRMRFTAEIESVVFGGNSTHVGLAVSLEGEGQLSHFGKAVLLIEKTEEGRYLSGLSLLPIIGGGLSHQYLFDQAGRLRWHLACDSSKRNKDGVFDGPDGFSLFEFAPDGAIRRTYFGNVLPLLVVTERTYFFTGDGDLIRQFMSDYVAASRRWGVKPSSLSDEN